MSDPIQEGERPEGSSEAASPDAPDGSGEVGPEERAVAPDPPPAAPADPPVEASAASAGPLRRVVGALARAKDRTAPFVARCGAGWRKEAILGGLVLLLLGYSWMYGDITVPNERTRIYLAVAVVDHGTLSIDEPVKRFGPLNDWARRDGHYYTDKAPGSSLLAAIPYFLVRRVTEPGDWSIAELTNLMRTWVMLPIGLLGFLWMRRLLRRLTLDEATTDLASLGWILGTSAFHYSAALYGHQIIAVCLLGALDCVLSAEDEAMSVRGSAWRIRARLLGAGMLAGLAGLTEYQSGIASGLLAIYIVAGPLRRRPFALGLFVLGALPFAVLLFGYNALAFGGPLKLSYQFLIDPHLREMHGRGIGGVSVPEWEYAWGGLFSTHRGFFTTSPVFLLSLPGLALMARRGLWRLSLLVGAALLYFLLFISSTEIWYAGWSFGPRLLVPVMAWATIPAAFAIAAMGRWLFSDGLARGLLVAGIAYHQLVNAVFAEMPENARNPVVDAVIPALRGRHVSPNLATKWLGWHGRASLAPLLVLGLGVVAWMLLRRRDQRPERSIDQRATIALAAIGVVGLLAVWILFARPGWNPGDVRWFTEWLPRLAEAELKLR